MQRGNLLNVSQICQLRESLKKIIQQNMSSFSTKVNLNLQTSTENDLQVLYSFCQKQYNKLQTQLSRIAEFTFEIMANVEMIWQQVYHRQRKILELRQSFSSATDYMQQLQIQNYQIKRKLTEAETYIQCIQYQKQILDALYYQKQRPSLSLLVEPSRNLNKCTSQRNLNYQSRNNNSTIYLSNSQKHLPYQKLKEYIITLKEERQSLQSQLMALTKQYQLKCQQCKKSNLFIQHLVQRINKKSQLKDYIQNMNNGYFDRQDVRYDFNPQDILKMLEKTDNTSSKRSFTNLNQQMQMFHINIIDTMDNMSNLESKKYEQHEDNISFYVKNQNQYKDTKDVMVNTDKLLKKSVTTQTDQQQTTNNKPDYKIEIQIYGKQKDKDMHIQKLLKNLNMQSQIKQKFAQEETSYQTKLSKNKKYQQYQLDIKSRQKYKKQRSKEKKTRQDQRQKGIVHNKWMSTYEYYQKKIISSRIKKYHYQKPHLNYLKAIEINKK